MTARRIEPGEIFSGDAVTLRLVTLDDCTERYVAWLNDPRVNRYLETRWSEQTLEMVRAFVSSQLASADSYLLAIRRGAGADAGGEHVGNIKIGPILARHSCADVSYFVGERSAWGQGLATDAIRVATRIGFDRLELHRLQAGAYARNVGSRRALEKAGYRLEATWRGQLLGPDGWEDHVWYGRLRDDP